MPVTACIPRLSRFLFGARIATPFLGEDRTMADHSDRETTASQLKADRIREIVNSCIALRAAGEQVADQSLLEAHADFAA